MTGAALEPPSPPEAGQSENLARRRPVTAFLLLAFGIGWPVLALPAMVSARLGVRAANRLPARAVRVIFGLVALGVAGDLLWEALRG